MPRRLVGGERLSPVLKDIKLPHIEFDNPLHCNDFVRLNEQWIAEYFQLEDSDRMLAKNPFKIVTDGGHLISLVDGQSVIGVCALFKDSDQRFEFARMAVEPSLRGNGYGEQLLCAALALAKDRGASSVYLVSNTILAPAINLYRKHGFITQSEGQHPVYARANIVMERKL